MSKFYEVYPEIIDAYNYHNEPVDIKRRDGFVKLISFVIGNLYFYITTLDKDDRENFFIDFLSGDFVHAWRNLSRSPCYHRFSYPGLSCRNTFNLFADCFEWYAKYDIDEDTKLLVTYSIMLSEFNTPFFQISEFHIDFIDMLKCEMEEEEREQANRQ